MTHPNIQAWRQEGDLTTLQETIHDGVPDEELRTRASTYRDAMFQLLYPNAAPRAGDRVLEIGPGVGWIMEAVLETCPDMGAIIGLDVSPEMSKAGLQRWTDPRVHYVTYDGLHWPFADDSLDVIYSCAAIQHVEKHFAFFILTEAYRTLKPGGHAVLHLMSVHHMSHAAVPYVEEAQHHVESRTDLWWHHYYSYDELFTLLSEVIGVDDLDIQPMGTVDAFCVHFSKGTGQRFSRPDVEALTYPARFAAPDGKAGLQSQITQLESRVAALDGELTLMKQTRAWRLAERARSGWRLVKRGARRRPA